MKLCVPGRTSARFTGARPSTLVPSIFASAIDGASPGGSGADQISTDTFAERLLAVVQVDGLDAAAGDRRRAGDQQRPRRPETPKRFPEPAPCLTVRDLNKRISWMQALRGMGLDENSHWGPNGSRGGVAMARRPFSISSWIAAAALSAAGGCAGTKEKPTQVDGGAAGTTPRALTAAAGASDTGGAGGGHRRVPVDRCRRVIGTDALGDAACAVATQKAQKVPLDLYIMLDSSGSMVERPSPGPDEVGRGAQRR